MVPTVVCGEFMDTPDLILNDWHVAKGLADTQRMEGTHDEGERFIVHRTSDNQVQPTLVGLFQPIFVYLLMADIEMMRPVFICRMAFSMINL